MIDQHHPSESKETMPTLLRAVNIDKRYGGVRALDGVSIEVEAGEVLALVGENGAGKSTLGKIIAGAVTADGGSIQIDGKPVVISNPRDAQRLGIAIIFQELDLFPNLTVAENIAIGNLHVQQKGFVNRRRLDQLVQPFLDQVELDISPSTILGDLTIGQMQLVAIARALSMDAKLIVMDESTSSLTDDAVEVLFRLIRKLKASGVAIVYVSHKMDEIFQICDRITVLRDGHYIDTKKTDETDVKEVIRMMVGRDVADTRREGEALTDRVIMSVKDLTTKKITGISFDLHRGEVLGVAGLVGAGRSELGNALFGIDKIDSGSVVMEGQSFKPRSPRDAMRHGIGLLPEDRKVQGLMMQMSVTENASLSVMRQLSHLGFVRSAEELARTKSIHTRTSLKAASDKVAVSSLSGGNQQKVLLARWLLVDPQVMFLDDPTRGVDVGAKQDIYEIIEELAHSGKGVILVSSELPELLHCCDRIMVLHDGHQMGTVLARETTQEQIMAMATRTVAA